MAMELHSKNGINNQVINFGAGKIFHYFDNFHPKQYLSFVYYQRNY
jgi:hypothetical protein